MSPTNPLTIRCVHLFHLQLRRTSVRFLSSTARHHAQYQAGPSPPRLPKEEQETFERLQKSSTGAFSTPQLQPQRPRLKINQSADSEIGTSQTGQSSSESAYGPEFRINAEGEGDELHPDLRRGATPEFEGDRNPKTGEVGGPKNEPLRWGESGDWSYNGRVTDF